MFVYRKSRDYSSRGEHARDGCKGGGGWLVNVNTTNGYLVAGFPEGHTLGFGLRTYTPTAVVLRFAKSVLIYTGWCTT